MSATIATGRKLDTAAGRPDDNAHDGTPEVSRLRMAATVYGQIVQAGGEMVSGRTDGDPLPVAIPGDGHAPAEVVHAVEVLTGATIARDGSQLTAPACRAALRRWALR